MLRKEARHNSLCDALFHLYVWYSEKFEDRGTENWSLVSRDLKWREENVHEGSWFMGELFEVIEIFYILILLLVTWHYTFVKLYQTVHFKWVNFIGCVVYLHKSDFKNARGTINWKFIIVVKNIWQHLHSK